MCHPVPEPSQRHSEVFLESYRELRDKVQNQESSKYKHSSLTPSVLSTTMFYCEPFIMMIIWLYPRAAGDQQQVDCSAELMVTNSWSCCCRVTELSLVFPPPELVIITLLSASDDQWSPHDGPMTAPWQMTLQSCSPLWFLEDHSAENNWNTVHRRGQAHASQSPHRPLFIMSSSRVGASRRKK